MRNTPSGTGFSATDLSGFLECNHKTSLDLDVLEGKLQRPGQNDIQRRLLERRGVAHEATVLEHYQRAGKKVVTITAQPGAEGTARAAEQTLAAMRAGAEVIYQAALAHENWSGRPDFLVRVDGADHYEVVDAKLSRETKARAVLQLCVYTDHLARVQGVTPKHFYIAGGKSDGQPERLLALDYLAYYRAVRRRFDQFTAQVGQAPYPEPVEHCSICHWWKRCEDRRRADDHLSLVAGITRRQRDRLVSCGVARVSELAALASDRAIQGVARESLERVREQARIQIAGRSEGKFIYELLPDAERGTGLEALPLPTAGDLFLDLEGDSFAFGEGLEYLFGLVDLGEPVIDTGFDFSERQAGPPRYHAFWASDPTSEKRAFEAVVDRIVRGREELPRLHVYHFGHREADALKKLSCRHKTREAEVDQLLRDHVLVDLHVIVRHALRASVEGYTLKQLEGLYGFRRGSDLRASAEAMQLFGWWLETADAAIEPDELRARIQSYNQDDCLSTLGLRDFLEKLRPELEARLGRKLARPSSDPAPDNTKEQNERRKTAKALAARLLAGDPEPTHQLMADLLEWHWREAKSGWWEYHRARELAPDDRLEDRSTLAGLRYEGVIGKIKRSEVHRYRFPEQEHAVRSKPTPIDPDTEKSAGTVVGIGPGHIDLKRATGSTTPDPRALIPGKPIQTDAQEDSLLALGEAIARDPDGSDLRAARELLAARPPRAGQAEGELLVRAGESVEAALSRLALALDGSVMAVQGPPGSGKTHQAALMILALVRAGKRVGVTGNSHLVIKNVLKKVAELGSARTLHIQDDDDDDDDDAPFEINDDKPRAQKRLLGAELDLVGGTSWTWASERFAGSVDVLVVDEAGQMSLANVLAVARAANSLVLFGDPAQLEQPQKGVHPPGAEVSALEHLLGDALTIPPERGVFLPHTRRLHPEICDFVSRVFYEGRLEPQRELGLERQSITGPGVFSGSGLRHVPVVHRGNSNQSPEEVEVITRLVSELLDSKAKVHTLQGEHPLGPKDIKIVAPYNAQVAALKRALPIVEIGTVDKFQGQEAPVVIYSLTTSSAEEAPRGLEFLYSKNRLNVAVSRAQALALVVGSPELVAVSCRTPRQMKLVNALCAYLEAAR